MSYERTLYPSACANRMTMPLFDDCGCLRPTEACQRVRVQNPACPGEYADVDLCVDGAGNLSICVRRPPKPCGCLPPSKRRRPACDCWIH